MPEAIDDLIEQSFFDLQEDFEELIYLFKSSLERLNIFERELHRTRRYIFPKTFGIIFDFLADLKKQYQKAITEIITLENKTRANNPEIVLLKKLEEGKLIYHDLFRSLQGLTGSLITSTDWQSPSAFGSLRSYAGRQTGKILANMNDYKRDVHLDEKEYEKAYRKEYIDARLKFNKFAFLTSSGMSAFTTVLDFLIMEGKAKGKVLIGKSVYFQNKQLIVKSLKGRIIEVDENETERIKHIIKYEKPGVIYFDSLSVTKNIAAPDLTDIISFIDCTVTDDVYLIIDNTCLTVSFQPFQLIKSFSKIHLIVIESLNKYHQFGTDRVTAGIITTGRKDAGYIFEYRKHSGANIADSSVYVLPVPDRIILERRLKRFERNASILSSALGGLVSYPGLPKHPSFKWSRNYPFHGSFFSISFPENKDSKGNLQKFIKNAVNVAKKQKVDLVSGTSFGFNTTRIYLTASYTDFTQPFVRISAGTEDRRQIESLKDVIWRRIT